ncbi:MAG: rRNA maturation RNase YbeY [Kiritimatiellia bacterium]
MRKVTQADSSTRWGEISVLLTDNEGICALNRDRLGRNETTDVLAFRYRPMPGENGLKSADIAVNVERAVEVASACSDSTAGRELALYLAHACDHLLESDDDAAPAGRRRMRRRELQWLREAGESLANNLI